MYGWIDCDDFRAGWDEDFNADLTRLPGLIDSESFRMDGVGTGSMEVLYRPIDGLIEGRRTRHPAADLIGKLAQILLVRGSGLAVANDLRNGICACRVRKGAAGGEEWTEA